MAVPFPPQYAPHTGTVMDDDDGVEVDRTADGAIALRQLYPQSYYDITLRWSALTRAQHEDLRAFLADNRLSELDITIDRVAYRVRQSNPLRVRWTRGASVAEVAVQVRGVRV